MQKKNCSKCKQDKPATKEYFYQRVKGQALPLHSWCRECTRAINVIGSRKRMSKQNKKCPKCRKFKPRTPEYWYFMPGRIDTYCRPCRKQYHQARKDQIDPAKSADRAIIAYRENRMSTQDLFQVISVWKGIIEAARIVDEERAAQGLPPMDYVGDLDIVSEDVEAFSMSIG